MSAQTIYGYATAVKPGNKIALINTEKHLDHTGGDCYFKDKGADIYGHSKINNTQKDLIDSFEDFGGAISNAIRKKAGEGSIAFENTSICNPDKKIDAEFSIDLGGGAARIILTPGHTDTNISIYNEKDRVLYCGDCLLPRFIPGLEGGGIKEWKTWISSLNKIAGIDIDIIVPGHGNIISGRENISKEIERLKYIITAAISNNKAPTIL
jgi:cyclase